MFERLLSASLGSSVAGSLTLQQNKVGERMKDKLRPSLQIALHIYLLIYLFFLQQGEQPTYFPRIMARTALWGIIHRQAVSHFYHLSPITVLCTVSTGHH